MTTTTTMTTAALSSQAPSQPKLCDTQQRQIPERIYEPNIIHNPRTWMGIWTPHGWRVHRKRWGTAEQFTVRLSGDGRATFFPEALRHPKTGHVEWQDDLHLKDDPFTDVGIYPSDPRVEYPVGNPRWAVSHTLLCYPVADHNLYTHEYTWDMTHGHLQTHFHKHVTAERYMTDSVDGRTVRVSRTPLSLSIEGNVRYPLMNSAVRGVWADPYKTGPNLYTRSVTQHIRMHNGIYMISPHTPVVQCSGVWRVLPGDPVSEVFDPHTGLCTDEQRVIEQFRIPLDEPRAAMVLPEFHPVRSQVYEGPAWMMRRDFATIDQAHLNALRKRMHSAYVPGKVGYSAQHQRGLDMDHYAGYCPQFDLNGNGLIDEEDEYRLAKHLGRDVRLNAYLFAYFGGDWLTSGVNFEPEHEPGAGAIAKYVYGAGYDSTSGTIRLFDTPGPNQPVWVEYYYDAPADAGDGNILVHLFRERGEI